MCCVAPCAIPLMCVSHRGCANSEAEGEAWNSQDFVRRETGKSSRCVYVFDLRRPALPVHENIAWMTPNALGMLEVVSDTVMNGPNAELQTARWNARACVVNAAC